MKSHPFLQRGGELLAATLRDRLVPDESRRDDR